MKKTRFIVLIVILVLSEVSCQKPRPSLQLPPPTSINEAISQLYITLNALHAGQYQRAYQLYQQNRRCRFELLGRTFERTELRNASTRALPTRSHVERNHGEHTPDTKCACSSRRHARAPKLATIGGNQRPRRPPPQQQFHPWRRVEGAAGGERACGRPHSALFQLLQRVAKTFICKLIFKLC